MVLTGPRQAGKTTLLRRLFGDSARYVSLDLPDVRASALDDPRGFLAAHPPPVVLDEAQQAPGLLPYIRERVDAHRDRAGQYLLSGSQNILLLERVTESLAGRAAILRLWPLTRREEEGRPAAPFPWESGDGAATLAPRTHGELWQAFLRGGYPELVTSPTRDTGLWHASYVQTYLERDVRGMRQVGDLTQFQAFLRAIAARSGQLLNLSHLGRDLGIAVNTVKAWLSVLEATHQVIILRPYFANLGKRLVKTPKVYFADLGTLCYLTGLKDPEHAAAGPMGGSIIETAVLTEIVKTLAHRGRDPQVYFWRTSAGAEVDILVEHEGKIVPIEVKLSTTPKTAFAAPIRAFQEDLGELAAPGYVVHPGDVRLPLGPGVSAVPFGEL